MMAHRLAALAIVIGCATLLRSGLVAPLDRMNWPQEGDFSILLARSVSANASPAKISHELARRETDLSTSIIKRAF